MANFYGGIGNDVANSALGELTGFTGTVEELTDGIGDFILGADGADFVFAGSSDDVIEGGQGSDQLNGAEGDDRIYANTETDLFGSTDGDEILGNLGNDQIFGSAGNDDLEGGDGNDVIQGNGGNDTMFGGANNDVFIFDADFDAGDRVYGGEAVGITGLTDELRLRTVNAVLAADSISGIELITFYSTPSGAVLNLTLHDGNVAASKGITVDASDVPADATLNLDYSAETDAFALQVNGGAGTENIVGRIGHVADLVDFSAGGSDRFIGSGRVSFGIALDATDRVTGKGFVDVYVDGDYSAGMTLTRSMFRDVDQLTMGATLDTANYAFTTGDSLVQAGESMTFRSMVSGTGSTFVDARAERDGSFTFITGEGNDTFLGGDGDDVFVLTRDPSSGVDVVHGGPGDDTFFVHRLYPDNAGDDIEAGPGFDTVIMEPPTAALSGDILLSVEKIVFVSDRVGASFSCSSTDTMVDPGATLILDCTSLRPYGLFNFDGTAETNGRFELVGGFGDDKFLGGAINDTLAGKGADDELFGFAGRDTLIGGAGRDALAGGGDKDTLTGGGGKDLFQFADAGGVDKVLDFQDGKDKFDLTGVAGVNGFGDLTLTDTGPSIEVDYGTGTFLIVNVGNLGTIDAGDFVFG